MIKIEKIEALGWEQAIRGMRNPMNSWDKSDSGPCLTHGPAHCIDCPYPAGDCSGTEADLNSHFIIGPNDRDLMMRLAQGGPVHAKYRRMIVVYADITAPLYWWKEFDTYKVGTIANSCSTMHKIQEKEFTLEDFSHEHLNNDAWNREWIESAMVDEDIASPHKVWATPLDILKYTIEMLNCYRAQYLETRDKDDWWQMIQLLPSSYNQKRTVMLNYEVLTGIYPMRKNHKLDEWREFCQWIEKLPYSEIITGGIDK